MPAALRPAILLYPRHSRFYVSFASLPAPCHILGIGKHPFRGQFRHGFERMLWVAAPRAWGGRTAPPRSHRNDVVGKACQSRATVGRSVPCGASLRGAAVRARATRTAVLLCKAMPLHRNEARPASLRSTRSQALSHAPARAGRCPWLRQSVVTLL